MKSSYKCLVLATCALVWFAGVCVSSARAAVKVADFDGDGKTDASLWNPDSGRWFILQSSDGELRHPVQLGVYCAGDILVPADYDGDGATDIAFYRPVDGNWFFVRSRSRTVVIQTFAGPGDPVQADYDGDGKSDFAFFNSATGMWRIRQSSNSTLREQQWGAFNDLAAPGDYDGDGLADLAVFRRSEGNWYVLKSSGGVLVQNWGGSGDQLVPADYDGDGKTDFAVFRLQEGNWYINQSRDGVVVRNWGGYARNGNIFVPDQLVPGDYDGDGRADVAVYREHEGNWYVLRSSDGGVMLLSLWDGVPLPATYLPEYFAPDPACN